MLVNSGVICAEHLRSGSREIENQESVELFCRTGQALRIFEDPEGCRHEDYYLKIGQAAIKKLSQATTMMDFGDNRMLNRSQRIAKARHGAAVEATRYRPIMVPYCDVAMSAVSQRTSL